MTTFVTDNLWTRGLHVSPESLIDLDVGHPQPEHLDFLGLMQARQRDEPVPDAVLVRDGQPLVYLWDARAWQSLDEQVLQQALRRLALRADAPFAAVVRPGCVQVFALAHLVDDGQPLFEESSLQPGLVARLAVGDVPVRSDGMGAHELMLELLNSATSDLIECRGLPEATALALMGRALFIRFLSDRGIVRADNPFPGVRSVSDCFATPEAAATTCHWLDATFNGDLLTLPEQGSRAWFASLDRHPSGSALSDLTAIVRGDKPVGDGAYQTRFAWRDLHFAYLPVGLLSQVYEEYVHRFETDTAKEDSVYYTPRHIAEYVVDHALGMLGEDAHKARILDPAAGGCVFLLTAFRRLVRARWRKTGKPPNTAEIRKILNKQLVGIDKNPAARQLSALALYLTALELDSNAHTLTNLRFDALQGRVLLAAEDWIDADSGLRLGSLSRPIWPELTACFDVVLGNPPWTSRSGSALHKALDRGARQAMADRGIDPVPNPDGVPDLPFVWQATRFAKPGAVIAFALHGRLLTKTTELGWQARRAVFAGLDVRYVVNGQQLRKTQVWPKMQATFCLLFALNQRSSAESRFYAVTPHLDESLNRYGRVRIDSKDSWAADREMVDRTPFLFKALAKGNGLDVELIHRIQGDSPTGGAAEQARSVRPPLEGYVTELDVPHGHGYQLSSNKMEAGSLKGLPTMPVTREARWFVVPTGTLPKFDRSFVHRTRDPRLYRAPVVILRKSPSSDETCPLAMIAFEDVAYNESYIGYSFAGMPNAEAMAVHLWAVLNSRLFLYYELMTSPTFGTERDAAQKSDIDTFPMIPLKQLTKPDRQMLTQWAKKLRKASGSTSEINEFVERLYGLTKADRQLVSDRLAFAAPFAARKRAARKMPTEAAIRSFCAHLEQLLVPFDLSAEPLKVTALATERGSPWRFLRLGAASQDAELDAIQVTAAIDIADALDSTLVEIRHGNALYVGILNQARYWSLSAARTLALELIKRDDALLRRKAS